MRKLLNAFNLIRNVGGICSILSLILALFAPDVIGVYDSIALTIACVIVFFVGLFGTMFVIDHARGRW